MCLVKKGEWMAAKRTIPVEKNQHYTARIEDYTHKGWGVAKIEGYPIFIEGALIGEVVNFRITSTGKSFSRGEVHDIIEESPHRVPIIGQAYAESGTMDLQHMNYEEQLRFKTDQVKQAISRIAKLDSVKVHDMIGMNFPYEYRNKAQVPVREREDGRLYSGFFKQQSHEVVSIENFIIQDPVIDEAITEVRQILEKHGLSGYDPATNTGDVRHIMIRRGHYTHEMMVVMVLNRTTFPDQDTIVSEIVHSLPNVVSIIFNMNTKKTNLVLGEQSTVLFGEDIYRDQLLGFTFNISHRSFFQVNTLQTEKLYEQALDYAAISRNDVVIDAYCGIGTLTLALAKKAQKVYGIEMIEAAVTDARKNAALNQVERAEFMTSDASQWMAQFVSDENKADIIVVDPPRKGLTEDFINKAVAVEPRRIVYISCNPATLARDLKLFDERGYTAREIQPVDMFPQTYHVEAIALIQKM